MRMVWDPHIYRIQTNIVSKRQYYFVTNLIPNTKICRFQIFFEHCRQLGSIVARTWASALVYSTSRGPSASRVSTQQSYDETNTIGNERLPKIILSNTRSLFFSTAISILVISNHNSFRVPFDKIASVYFIWKKCIYILASGTGTVPIVSAHFRSYIGLICPSLCPSSYAAVLYIEIRMNTLSNNQSRHAGAPLIC